MDFFYKNLAYIVEAFMLRVTRAFPQGLREHNFHYCAHTTRAEQEGNGPIDQRATGLFLANVFRDATSGIPRSSVYRGSTSEV